MQANRNRAAYKAAEDGNLPLATCTAPRSGRDVVPQLARGVIADAPAGASS
jgi:hypothetical protein